jgi:hypothetical protein
VTPVTAGTGVTIETIQPQDLAGYRSTGELPAQVPVPLAPASRANRAHLMHALACLGR